MSEILGKIDINNYGLQNMEVSSGGEVNLQSKDVTINQNGTITITADSGYDGLSDVDVTVSGILDTSDATATASDIANAKVAYAKGVKITGNVPTGSPVMATTYPSSSVTDYLGDLMVNATQSTTNQFFSIGDKLSILAPASDVATAVGLTANILKKDEVVLGVTGTYEGSSDIDWSAIGYSSTPQAILDGYDYAENIYNNWTPKSDCAAEFVNNRDLVIMPLVDTSITEDMTEMFHGCSSLMSVPLLDTYLVGGMGAMFMECTALKSIPLFNTENVTNMQDMFNACYSLETVPQLNTGLVARMRNMFMNCWSLTSIPLLDTSAAMDMRNMFYGCMSLTTVPALDTSTAEYMDSMFYNCPSLTNQSLNNILAMCANSAVTEFKTLKSIGLTSSQAATCETLSNWSAFVAAGWSKGY